MTKFFITGTDTDCGKTYVTCNLLDYFLTNQQKVLAIKPIVSGAIEDETGSYWQDLKNLEEHNPTFNEPINLFKFKAPVSPHLAAKSEEMEISLKELINFCNRGEFKGFEHLLIEGAGGVLVPINDKDTWLDFLKQSQFEVIIVVAIRLGCINHALLTESVLNSAGIKVKGWIANCIEPNMLMLNENIETLTKKMVSPMIAKIPYKGSFERVLNAHWCSET
ncbi:MAG: dethiobiotin synthase [Proteobacteria bacterium]|nr:dethiobiotin synthase [Pseudomonadota bacterium]